VWEPLLPSPGLQRLPGAEGMIIDGHIHILKKGFSRDTFLQKLEDAGIEGGIIFSLPPENSMPVSSDLSFEERIDNLTGLCNGDNTLFPFFWIDPIADDAEIQVDRAVKKGIRGFKVICNRYYPDDKKALHTFNVIAEHGYPVMFHSGILWDGTVSSKYNRPINFEILLTVRNLRFSLAHISWPWTDELIALYGKFQNAYQINPDVSCEMFIDTTPGTPAVYREEVFRKLLNSGYRVEDNLFFGTDSLVEDYDTAWAAEWVERDHKIFKNLDKTDGVIDKYFSINTLRFINGRNKNGRAV